MAAKSSLKPEQLVILVSTAYALLERAAQNAFDPTFNRYAPVLSWRDVGKTLLEIRDEMNRHFNLVDHRVYLPAADARGFEQAQADYNEAVTCLCVVTQELALIPGVPARWAFRIQEAAVAHVEQTLGSIDKFVDEMLAGVSIEESDPFDAFD